MAGEILDPVLQKGIKLNEEEKADIIAFLKTLTDKTFLHDRRFDNPYLEAYRTKNVDEQPVNEDALVARYKSEWDAIQLNTIAEIPQYATYIDELDKITEAINRYTKQHNTKLPKLEELHAQLQNSKKHKDAIKDYFIYGQPASVTELTESCKQALLQNNKTGIELVHAELKKVDKTGWVVLISYKIKGSVNIIKAIFQLSYNPLTKSYMAIEKK